MPVLIKVAAENEPISLAEAKKHLRLDPSIADDDDALIEKAISAARKAGEKKTHRTWIVQTYDAFFHVFPDQDQPLELPLPPLLSVESVQYVDPEGVAVTMPVEDYEVDTVSMVGSIFPAFNKVWPDTRGTRNGIVVRFRAGYEKFPADLEAWLKITMEDIYLNKESGSNFIESLLEPYIIPVVA